MALCLAATFSTTALAAVSTPYSQNFDSLADGNVLPPDFLEGGSGTNDAGNNSLSTIVAFGGGKGYRQVIGGGQNTFGIVQAPQLVGQAFSVSTQFSATSFTSGTGTSAFATVGLTALASSDSTSGYRANLNFGTGNLGRLQISEIGSADITANTTAAPGSTLASTNVFAGTTLTPTANTIYTLTLTGSYQSGVLTLLATLTDGVTTIMAAANDSTVKTGEYFGLRTAASDVTGTDPAVTAVYDNFNLIPEPSVISIGALGALGLFRRRRH